MAVWQFDFWIIPKIEVLRHFQVVPDYVELDWFESIDWWGDTDEYKFVSLFDDLLPRFGELAWGKPNETFARLAIEDSHLQEVFVRIDARNVKDAVLSSLVKFALPNKFMFYVLDSNRFLEPEWSSIVSALNRSRASQFASDPEKFLTDSNYLGKINREIKRKMK